MQRTKKIPPEKISTQVKKVAETPVPELKELDGNFDTVISTGSTLLDLAISGSRTREGGLPGGIFVEIFGPSGAGKTVLLCEIAGSVQRQGGQVMFRDPEARLDKVFAQIFDLNMAGIAYDTPSTVPEVFAPIRKWTPEPDNVIHGVFADSLAALTTNWEMEDKDGMGMRRAKEFSEECRKTCRVIADKNFLMVCSNQVRQNADAGPFGQKYRTPGGEAIGFYASLRLRCSGGQKIKWETTVAGKTIKRVIGITTQVEVFKSSIDKPFRMAPVSILFDYGIDDVRQNLKFCKEYTTNTAYSIGEMKLHASLERAIQLVEEQGLEKELREATIILWNEIEARFDSQRKKKERG